MSMLVAGVDAYRRSKGDSGWVAVVLADQEFKKAFTADSATKLLDQLEACERIGIDMPIGLPTDRRRECDQLARAFVGDRRNSVFFAPTREALLLPTHKEATARNKELTGHGISAQAYALRDRIFELEAALEDCDSANDKTIEVHPEVSFRELAGAETIIAAKKCWAGQAMRRTELQRVGIEVPDDPGHAGRIPADDLLDAAVAAWTADRYRRHEARSFPEVAAHGQRQVIWR